jgi:hypothetical protein
MDGDDPIEDADEPSNVKKPVRKRAPRKPKPSKKSGTDDDEAEFTSFATAPSGPRRRSIRRANGKSASESEDVPEPADDIEMDDEEPAPRPKANGTSSASHSSPAKKRRRPDDEPVEEEEEPATSPQGEQAYKSRRKRARAAL